jgi:hypothetical protein
MEHGRRSMHATDTHLAHNRPSSQLDPPNVSGPAEPESRWGPGREHAARCWGSVLNPRHRWWLAAMHAQLYVWGPVSTASRWQSARSGVQSDGLLRVRLTRYPHRGTVMALHRARSRLPAAAPSRPRLRHGLAWPLAWRVLSSSRVGSRGSSVSAPRSRCHAPGAGSSRPLRPPSPPCPRP